MQSALYGGAGAEVGTGAASHREPVGARRLAPGAREPEAFAICTAARLLAAGEHNAGLLLRRAFRVCSAAVEFEC